MLPFLATICRVGTNNHNARRSIQENNPRNTIKLERKEDPHPNNVGERIPMIPDQQNGMKQKDVEKAQDV